MKGSAEFSLETFLKIVAVLFFAALIFALKDMLTPLIVYGLIMVALFPVRTQRYASSVMILASLLIVMWFLAHTRDVLFPFVISFVFAYFFDPLADRLETWKLPRGVAIGIIILVLIGMLSLGLIIVVPQIVHEIQDLLRLTLEYAPQVRAWLERNLAAILYAVNLDLDKISSGVLEQVPSKINTVIQSFFQGVLNITAGVSAAVSSFLNLILIPFLTFYFLKDYDSIRAKVRRLIPPPNRPAVDEVATKIDRMLSGYIRGQLTVCGLIAVATSAGLYILGIRYALLLGIISGVLNLIPYVGLMTSLGLALIVALFSPDPLTSSIKVAGVFLVVQSLEGSVISPRIVGDSVGLSPVLVIFSILIFSHFLGFVGLLIAVPLMAALKILLEMWLNNYYFKKIAAEE